MVNKNIKISFEMIQEFDKILWMIARLIIAYENAEQALNLVRSDQMYEGKAKDEMILFYYNSCKHIESLINLYGKAHQYALNAIINMLEQDTKLAKRLQEAVPW